MHFTGRRGAGSVGRVRAVGKQVFADSPRANIRRVRGGRFAAVAASAKCRNKQMRDWRRWGRLPLNYGGIAAYLWNLG
jgi:hypothetical protein